MSSEQPDADEVQKEVEAHGRRCLLLAGDVASQAFCQEAVERTVAELGTLSILVSNAAHLVSKTELRQLNVEDWDRTFKVNAYAFFYLVMAALPHLEAGASIIATSSEEGMKGSPIMMDYAASKGAIESFSKSIAPHLARDGIRVNVVVPGPTWTPLNIADQGMPMSVITDMGSTTMFQRPAQPEEVAPTYVFLASDADSSYITGEVIDVTGGLTVSR